MAYCVAAGAALLVFNVYALLLADANHTGLPLAWLWLFAMAGGLGTALALLVGQVGGHLKRLAWLALIVSALTLLNLAAFEELNVMMAYDVWVLKGMPARP